MLQKSLTVPEGTTILDAAKTIGIEIPTMCFLKGCKPSTSCMVCIVRVNDSPGLVPACATVATEGMQIESESESNDIRAQIHTFDAAEKSMMRCSLSVFNNFPIV